MYMLQTGDYKSWISIEGKPRPVFGVESTLKSMSCWIPSENKKKFSVNWHNKRRTIPIQATIEIDGVICDTHIMLDAQRYPNRPHGIGVSYARTSDQTRRDFMFSTINGTDDETYLDAIDMPTEIGTIKLRLWKLHVISVDAQPLQHQPATKLLGGQPQLHERSRKAGTHHVVFGDEYASPAPIVDVVHAYRTEDEPFMTFIFKYRPIDVLKARGIVNLPSISPLLRSAAIPYSPLTGPSRDSHLEDTKEVGPLRSRRTTTRLQGLGPRRGHSSGLTSPELSPLERTGGFLR